MDGIAGLGIASRKPLRGNGCAPLVFVHGACATKACWEAHMLDWFAERGFDVHALDLRGHGDSSGRQRLNDWGIADYVEDLRRVTAALDRPAVLVGHSMGGLVVQKYLERHPAAGGVLMASVPVGGMWRQTPRMAWRHPIWFTRVQLKRQLGALYASDRAVRTTLLPPEASDELVREVRAGLGNESWRATQDMNWLQPRPQEVSVPMLVLGGKLDFFMPPSAVLATARAYRAPCVLFEGMAHLLNVEPGWQQVAQVIDQTVRQWTETPMHARAA